MGDPSNQAKAIFLEALEGQTPEQWPAFLEQACAGDAGLRAEVERLLRARAEMGSFHEAPAPALFATADEPIRECPGSAVGPYKLLEQIGEGGFGVVFMAEQRQPIRRKVALKVLKPGMDTRQVVARFEAERQALALMDHPNIARVFDGGETTAGRPYFVMELVRGVPITEFCDENQLSIRERLALFVDVCQAVQHAHMKGVIHRDIKPSNVLVTLHDGQPVAKVIDFGIAKAAGGHLTDKTLFTHFHQMVGTPLYMSPEQAQLSGLDVDTRSDVYSLGVLLYELLTGTTPFDKERLRTVGFDELRRIIREEEPPRPSTRLSIVGQAAATVSANRRSDPRRLSRLLRGELDWVVMKPLEKDRTRRYESASAFAADVQRYLHDEPVQACPPSAGYRLRKFLRRHRGPVLGASGIGLLLVAGIVGTSIGMVRATTERDEKEKARRQAVAAATAEAEARRQTRQALNTMTDLMMEDLLERQVQVTDRHREFLKKVLDYHAAFAAAKAEDAVGRESQAEGFFRVGRIRHFLGELKEAEAAYDQAVVIQKDLMANFPDRADFRQQLADSEDNLGLLLRETGRLPAAEAAHTAALGLRKQLAHDSPSRPELRHDLARTHLNLGIVLKETGRLPEAEASYRAAWVLSKQLVEERPKQPDYRQGLARSLNNLANLMFTTGRVPAAETAYNDALALHKQLVADYPRNPDLRRELALNQHNLGAVMRQTGRPKEAEISYRAAQALLKDLMAEFPARPDFREDLARTQIHLGNLLRDTGRPAEAEASCRAALATLKQLTADIPGRPELRHGLAVTYADLSNLLHATGQMKEAEAACRDAIALMKQLAAGFPDRSEFRQNLAGYQYNLANILRAAGRFPEAETAYRKALALQQKLAADFRGGPGFRRDLALSHLNLGNLLRDTRRPKEAETAWREATVLFAQLTTESPKRADFRGNLAKCQNNLGLLYAGQKNYAEAEKAYSAALGIHEQLASEFPDAPDHQVNLAITLLNCAILDNHRQEFAAAIKLLERASPLQLAAIKSRPKNPKYRQNYRDNLRVLAWSQSGLADHAALAATAEKLVRFGFDPANDAYNASGYLCISAQLAEKDAHLAEPKRKEQAQRYADQAMAMLRQAAAHGFKDVASIKDAPDFEPLRAREDFKKLLVELEANSAKK
jgi:serine/threonine protein kinase/tetratricopeptide (TPR) repeat protein